MTTDRQPDRLTPSEALEEIKRRYDGRSETTSVSPETLKLPTLMLFDHVAAALARPTPGEELMQAVGVYLDAHKAAKLAGSQAECEEFAAAMSTMIRKQEAMAEAYKRALAAQPASPPPTQGWEEALAWLERECLLSFDHDETAKCCHCDGPDKGDRIEHAEGCPVVKRVATLRSHLSGRETRETNKPQE